MAMRKIILILALLLVGCSCFAEEQYEYCFTWAEYEMMCYKRGTEPTWEEYEWYCNNPQCYGDDDGSIIMELF